MSHYLLPIGSVVQLKNSTARVMVAGYLTRTASNPDYVWDYSGFKFPIGYVSNDEVYCFDQEQIEEVLALGYQDTEQFIFIDKLDGVIAKVKGENQQHTQETAEQEPAEGQEEA